jgi:microcystin-dependent protein
MVGFNFAPRGWATCDGQLLSISQNTALFSIVGTIYGGDGRTTFGLPNLQDRAPIGQGQGPGLSSRTLGQRGGVESETLSLNQMPQHNHNLMASPSPGEQSGPLGPGGTRHALARSVGGNAYTPVGPPSPLPPNLVNLAGASLDPTGGGEGHNNRQPYLAVNFVIALIGIFPSRS